MLPMSLHRDAVAFYGLALGAEDLMLIERYVRAAVLAAFASLEAQLNMAAQATRTRTDMRLIPWCTTSYWSLRQRSTNGAA